VRALSGGGFGLKILSSAGVFTAEISALFTVIRQTAEVIRPPERCLILTDSLSLIKAMLSSVLIKKNLLEPVPEWN
jgi:hypothetical protein